MKRRDRISLHEAAAELEVAATTILRWERTRRIPRLKRHANPYGGHKLIVMSRESLNHVKELRRIRGPRLQDYWVGKGVLPVGK